jgi:AraC-like DNA-binding protein
MADAGLTKARSMGPVAAAVQRAGGSVERLLQKAELPSSLMDRPEILIPLRDQLTLLELATRETGDDALPARLSLDGGVEHLGAFGRHVCRAPTLEVAIVRCNHHMRALLQSATCLQLSTVGRVTTWSYAITDSVLIGRQKNELLALGYMLDLLRRFFGVSASAVHARLPGMRVAGHGVIEQLFGCDLTRGPRAALVFPTEYLQAPNRIPPERRGPSAEGATPLPEASDLVAHVEQMIVLGMLEQRPREAWLCRRLGISRRSLQRSLASRNTSFQEILRRELLSQATDRLACVQTPITQIALDLGYTDPAHFTRAFVRCFGESPQAWRRRLRTTRMS